MESMNLLNLTENAGKLSKILKWTDRGKFESVCREEYTPDSGGVVH